MGLDGANAHEESSCPFTETTRLASGICFPLWSGLSEPSQTHGALGSLTRSGLELLRESDPCLGHGELGAAVGPWGAGWPPRGSSGGGSQARKGEREARLPGQVTPGWHVGSRLHQAERVSHETETRGQDSQLLFTPFSCVTAWGWPSSHSWGSRPSCSFSWAQRP